MIRSVDIRIFSTYQNFKLNIYSPRFCEISTDCILVAINENIMWIKFGFDDFLFVSVYIRGRRIKIAYISSRGRYEEKPITSIDWSLLIRSLETRFSSRELRSWLFFVPRDDISTSGKCFGKLA